MNIQILSDVHYDINNDKLKDYIKENTDSDVVLIAGDIAGSLDSTKKFLETYFPNSTVYFVNGNHFVYNNENKTINKLISEYKEEFPIDSGNYHFLQNQWCWLDKEHTIALIGCIFWTDYKYHSRKEFHTILDEQGRRLDKNGNLLPEDPTKTEEFRNKVKAIWDDETTDLDTKDKLIKDLYHSIHPDNNERVDTSFKNRVSEEVYNNYISWQESFGKEGKREFTKKEYVNYNMNKAYRYMNDFRYGKIEDYTSYNGWIYMNPDDCLQFHKNSKKYIKKAYDEILSENPNAKIILMTHHPLTSKAINPQYANSDLNAAFTSDLEKWINKFENIKLIISGHVHNAIDIKSKGKRYLINAFGYMMMYEYEDFNSNLIINVENLD